MEAAMLLYVNACVRKDSRTKLLADYLISHFDEEISEIRLGDIQFPVTDEEFLRKRDHLIANRRVDDEMFKYARLFAVADAIVIAAPFWDLSFPSSLKHFFENINVIGLTFEYNEKGIPVGLCKANKLYYVTTAGGTIFNEEYGFGYVKALAQSFYGINDCKLIKTENLDIIGSDVTAILSAAKAEIDSLF